MSTGLSFKHEYMDIAEGIPNALGETYSAELQPDPTSWLGEGVELSSLADFSLEAKELSEQGWRWIGFSVEATTYDKGDMVDYQEGYVIEQREDEDELPEDTLKAEARERIVGSIGAPASIVLAKPLELPSPDHTALLDRVEFEYTGGLPLALERYHGALLVAALNERRNGYGILRLGEDKENIRRSIHIEGGWVRREAGGLVANPSEAQFSEAIVENDYLDKSTWELIAALRDKIYNAAVTEIGEQVVAKVQAEAAIA